MKKFLCSTLSLSFEPPLRANEPRRRVRSPEISEGRVLKGGLVVAVGLVSAQIAGFIRQATIGYLLGTGRQADALSPPWLPSNSGGRLWDWR